MIKLKNLLKEDLYTTAGYLIPQMGPVTPKNAEKWKSDEHYAKKWNNYTGGEANEKKLLKITDEYYKWLGSELPTLQKIYNSGPYQMHLASLKSGGSSSQDYDYLGNLIRTMKQHKAGEAEYR
jgi:hypothetical protein